MNVSLTPKLETYIKRKVASGLYNNASEVIREALRLLVAHEGESPVKSPREALRKPDIVRRLASLEKPLRARGVTSLALFGSVVRGTARADSDIDILVDVASDARFSLIDLAALTDFLQDRFGRKVDVVTKEGLDSLIRDRVLREAEGVF